jgi:hypothetical protein
MSATLQDLYNEVVTADRASGLDSALSDTGLPADVAMALSLVIEEQTAPTGLEDAKASAGLAFLIGLMVGARFGHRERVA